MSFREDGAATLEWVADYLDRLRDFPVLAQVEPGEIRSRLPAEPPERGEPFASVLRDVDETLMPGVTHWQSPRYFAYFGASGEVFLSGTRVDGRFVLRLAIGNARTTEDDVRVAWDVLRNEAA